LNNPEFATQQVLPADADPNDPKSYARYRGSDYAPDLMAEQAVRFVRDNRSRPFFLYFASAIPHLALQVPEMLVARYAGKWPDAPYTGTNRYLPHLKPRAAYAAMISRLDEHVGQLMQTVDELGLSKNTICIFTSDNGPLYGRLGGTDCEFFESAANLRGRKVRFTKAAYACRWWCAGKATSPLDPDLTASPVLKIGCRLSWN